MERRHRLISALVTWTVTLSLFSFGVWKTSVDAQQRNLAIDARERAFDALMGSTRHALAILNAEGMVVSWNPAAEELTGYAADDMIGCDVYDLIPADKLLAHRAAFFQAIERLGKKGETQRVQCDLVTRGGVHVPVEVSVRVYGTGRSAQAVAHIAPQAKIRELLE